MALDFQVPKKAGVLLKGTASEEGAASDEVIWRFLCFDKEKGTKRPLVRFKLFANGAWRKVCFKLNKFYKLQWLGLSCRVKFKRCKTLVKILFFGLDRDIECEELEKPENHKQQKSKSGREVLRAKALQELKHRGRVSLKSQCAA